MEYLGEDTNTQTCIYRFPYRESQAIRRLAYALTKTPMGKEKSSFGEHEAIMTKGIGLMDQLSEMLEKGPVRLTFEPIEFEPKV